MSIQYKDIFAQDVLKQIQLLNKELVKMSDNLKEVAKAQKTSTTGGGEEFKNNEEALKKLNIAAQEKIKIDKQIVSNQKLLSTQLEKNITTEKEYIQTLELEKENLKIVAKESGKLSQEYAEQKLNIDNLKKAYKETLKEQQKQEASFKEITTLINKNATSLNDLKAKQKELRTELGKVSIETEEGRQKQKLLISALNTTTTAIKSNSDAYVQQKMTIGNYKTAVSGLSKTMGTLNSGFATLGLSLGAATIAMKGISAVKEAITTIVDFEESISGLQAVLGDVSDEEFDATTAKIKELGSTTQFTASEVAELSIEFAKLGFTAREIRNAAEGTLFLAQASGETLASAAEVAGSTLRAFNLDATETNRVTDVMAKSFSSSALDLEKFRESMKLVAPIASAANIDIETTTSLLAKLADAGLSGSIAGTSLKNLISKLADSSSDLSKELGYTVTNSTELMQAFNDLSEKNIDLTAATELTDERSKAAFITLINGASDIETLAGTFADAEGAAAEMAEIMGDNVAGALKRLQSAYEGALLSIQTGDTDMSKVVQNMLDFAANVLNAAQNTNVFGEILGFVIDPVRELFSSLGSLFSAFSFLNEATEEGEEGLSGLEAILKVLGTTTKLALAPLKLVFEALGFLADITEKVVNWFIDLINENEVLSERFQDFKGRLNDLKEIFSALIKVAITPFKQGLAAIQTVIQDVSMWFKEMSKDGKFLGEVIDFINGVIDGLGDGFDWVLSKIKALLYITEEVESKVYADRVAKFEEMRNKFSEINDEVVEDVTETNDEIVEDEGLTADEIFAIREELGLIKMRELYRKELEQLQEYLDQTVITESEFLELKEALYNEYFTNIGEIVEAETQTVAEAFGDGLTTSLEDAVTNAGEGFKVNFIDRLKEQLQSEDLKTAIAELGDELVGTFGTLNDARQEELEKSIELRDTNIEDFEKSLEEEKSLLKERQEAGAAFDTARISELQANIAKEEQLREQEAEKLKRIQKRQIIAELVANQASAIGYLIRNSQGNPLNLLTGGLAGQIQFAVGLAQIIANFANAKSQIQGLHDGTDFLEGKPGRDKAGIFRLERGERVVPAYINSQLRGVANRDLPDLINRGSDTRKMEGLLEGIEKNTKQKRVIKSNVIYI